MGQDHAAIFGARFATRPNLGGGQMNRVEGAQKPNPNSGSQIQVFVDEDLIVNNADGLDVAVAYVAASKQAELTDHEEWWPFW